MNKKVVGLFVKVPQEMFLNTKGRLIGTDFWTYSVIRSHVNEKTHGRAFPSLRRIANIIGCDTATIWRSIKRLEKAGYIKHVSGKKGRSNEYSFADTDVCMDTCNPYALVQVHSGNNEMIQPAVMPNQSDSYNKTHKSERPVRLYHGNDICWIDEGVIRIKNHLGQWVDYSGGDDARFRFGEFAGSTARRAAIEHFKDRKPYSEVNGSPDLSE